ncbi:7581_t:CDS:2, partial [Dentiscutata heterogama]
MKLEYQVELPDHDWVVAERHKLISSDYAVLDEQEDKYEQAEAITYSAKEKLHNFTIMDSQPKPMVVMISDGKPNENPCYRKTVQMIVNHFIKYNLDTIIMACYTPHQSISNSLKTSNEELEKHNFKYIEPFEESHCLNKKSAAWIEKHVITCRYMTQVIKCDDPSCYKPFRSKIKQVLPNHFFLPPLLLQQKLHSICTANMGISDNTTHFGSFLLSVLMEGKLTSPDANLYYFSFDWYCPTINKSINKYLYYESSESMQIDEEIVLEDLLETYLQKVQVHEKLIVDR